MKRHIRSEVLIKGTASLASRSIIDLDSVFILAREGAQGILRKGLRLDIRLIGSESDFQHPPLGRGDHIK